MLNTVKVRYGSTALRPCACTFATAVSVRQYGRMRSWTHLYVRMFHEDTVDTYEH